jgi:hypothetical protein
MIKPFEGTAAASQQAETKLSNQPCGGRKKPDETTEMSSA